MKILVSGGGIAGLVAAMLLHRSGHEVTVIDKAQSFQKLGYGLSLKGFGIELIDQLGLLAELKQHELPITIFEIYRSDNKPIRTIPKATIDVITGGAIPVARAELHGVLYEAAKRQLPIRFDTQITAIKHQAGKERVTLSDHETAEYDLVVVAEGLRSSTRQLLWNSEGWQPFDIMYAAAIINQPHDFTPGHAYTYRGIGKTIAFFPVTKEQVVIQAYFRTSGKSPSHAQAKDLLLETYGDFAPHVIGLLRSISHDDYFFYDRVAMIELPSLAKGCESFGVTFGDHAARA
jgi:2-polyprenyl-6-methoxyphenol hydroxylase-like FAD-dependent oxidoreductase